MHLKWLLSWQSGLAGWLRGYSEARAGAASGADTDGNRRKGRILKRTPAAGERPAFCFFHAGWHVCLGVRNWVRELNQRRGLSWSAQRPQLFCLNSLVASRTIFSSRPGGRRVRGDGISSRFPPRRVFLRTAECLGRAEPLSAGFFCPQDSLSPPVPHLYLTTHGRKVSNGVNRSGTRRAVTQHGQLMTLLCRNDQREN